MKKLMTLGMIALVLTGCPGIEGQKTNTRGTTGEQGAQVPKFTVAVSKDGAEVFQDGSSSSSFVGLEGAYNIRISALDGARASGYLATIQQMDIPNPPPAIQIELTDSASGNVINLAAGTYSVKIQARDQNNTLYAARVYQASVNCISSTSLEDLVNAASSQITVAGGDNVYAFTSPTINDPNGQVYCAWDFNGDLRRDSAFGPCGATISNVYVSYIKTRGVGLIVKNSCNETYIARVDRDINFDQTAYTPGDGKVWIETLITGGTGLALTDPALFKNSCVDPNDAGCADGTKTFWTNKLGQQMVHPTFNGQTFTESAVYAYGGPSSKQIGTGFSMSGIVTAFGDDAASTSINLNNAFISRQTFTTDEGGDTLVSTTHEGSNCTLIEKGGEVVSVVGTPCTSGSTNPDRDNKEFKYKFHFWGKFSCTDLSTQGSTISTLNRFDGLADVVDGCVGGGGQGQGGIAPPAF